jgi:predicted aspartyl protease
MTESMRQSETKEMPMRTTFETETPSRRALLGWGMAGAALLPGIAPARGAAISAEPTTKASPDPQTEVAATSDLARHMTIKVTIDGKGPFQFVVDTGADRSVLADSVARELGLLRDVKVLVEGVVRTVPAETAHVKEIAFGTIKRTGLVLPVLPRDWLMADGYLGLDMIDGYRLTMDFAQHTFSVNQPRSIWLHNIAAPNEDLVAANGKHGHLRALNCRVDGIVTSVFIDTGASISLGNPALFEALDKRDPDRYLKNERVRLDGVTGGTIDGRVTDFHRIKVGGIEFLDGTLVIADLQIFRLWDIKDKPAMLIGMNFLRQFNKVIIDYGRKEFRFEVARLYISQLG